MKNILSKETILLFLSAFLVYFTSVYIYMTYYPLNYESFFYALIIFIGDVKAPQEILSTPKPLYGWKFIYLFGFFGLVISAYTAITTFAKLFLLDIKLKIFIKKGNHIIIFGLGENNKVYIESELSSDKYQNKIIIIEQNKDNLYIQHFNDKGIPVLIGDATDLNLINSLSIQKSKHIVISVGDDMMNLEIATQILSNESYQNHNKPIYIHIEDRSLRHFHKNNGIFQNSNIKIFSYYADAARELFEKYDIDGLSSDLIQSDSAYSIVVVGNNNLAYEVIFQACIIGQLPNENQLTIYCIDKDASDFQQNIELNYTEIQNVPNVKLIYLQLDPNSKVFYLDEVWQSNPTNIILCYENDQKNLDIASNLANISFLQPIAEDSLNTKILIAMFNSYNLSGTLKNNNQIFKNFFVFGQQYDINNKKYLIDEERDKMAKAVNALYVKKGPIAIEELTSYQFKYIDYDMNDTRTGEELWKNLSYFKKESNRAVADQIKTKLKYLGLRYEKNDLVSENELLKLNETLYYSHVNNEFILAKNEHNRWNAFHYLNGYKQIPFLSKTEKKRLENFHESSKAHMCLVSSYEVFGISSNELIQLGYNKWQFEGYDFMINHYIPLILSQAGYEIKE